MPRLFLDDYLKKEERPQDNEAKLRAYQLSRDPALREELILDNLRLVFFAFRHIRQSLPEGMETEDAISFGIAGLIESIDRYDVTKGQFTTLAYPRIQGAIYDGIGRFSRLRRSDRRIFYAAEHARQEAEREEGRELCGGELAEALGRYGVRLDRYLTVSANRIPTPLEEAAELADGGLGASPDAALLEEDTRRTLREKIGKLSEKERAVILDHYYRGLSFRETAAGRGMSTSAVCRAHRGALDKLRSDIDPEEI